MSVVVTANVEEALAANALPEPRTTSVTFEVDGVARTLTERSTFAGIPEATLFHRVPARGWDGEGADDAGF